MPEFLGPRPGEDLSVLGEVDLWMEKWIALVLQDSYKLLELWWIMHFYSSESLTVCNMCLTHWNHLMSTLTTNLSEVFTSRKFQMHLQLVPEFLHQDAPQAFPTQDILNRILSSKTWSFFTLHPSCLRWKARIILNVTLSPDPHPTGHQVLSSLSHKYFVIRSLISTVLGQAFTINSLNWFLKNFSRSLYLFSLFSTIFWLSPQSHFWNTSLTLSLCNCNSFMFSDVFRKNSTFLDTWFNRTASIWL